MKIPNLASEISFGPGDATVTVPAAVPMQEPSSLLVKFAILVLETSRFHCALAQRTILTYQTNPLAFLHEYHKRVGTVPLTRVVASVRGGYDQARRGVRAVLAHADDALPAGESAALGDASALRIRVCQPRRLHLLPWQQSSEVPLPEKSQRPSTGS